MNDAEKKYVTATIKRIFDEIRDVVVAKNENYGVEAVFSPPYLCPNVSGGEGIFVRLSDKFARLKALRDGEPDKVGESAEDTLRDIVGYCVLALTNERITREGRKE